MLWLKALKTLFHPFLIIIVGSHSRSSGMAIFFFKKSFWISVDVSSGFQSQSGVLPYSLFVEANVMYIPRDPPQVLHMPTSWQPAHSQSLPHMHVQRWDLPQIRTGNHPDRRHEILTLNKPGDFGYWAFHSVGVPRSLGSRRSWPPVKLNLNTIIKVLSKRL